MCGSGIFKVYQAAGYYHNSNNQKTSEDFRAKSTGTNTGKSFTCTDCRSKTSPAAQVTSTPVTGLNADEQLTLELINKERTKAALSHSKLMQSCRKWQGSKRRIWLKRTISPPVPDIWFAF